ncbi:hypothetical protein ACOSP7_013193 [Xanthoceras sorbifolium]
MEGTKWNDEEMKRLGEAVLIAWEHLLTAVKNRQKVVGIMMTPREQQQIIEDPRKHEFNATVAATTKPGAFLGREPSGNERGTKRLRPNL